MPLEWYVTLLWYIRVNIVGYFAGFTGDFDWEVQL